MAMLSFCGIDVSKDRLDVVVLPEGWFFSVSNDTAGWAELVVRLRPLTVSAIGLEPSGGYERGIIRGLLAEQPDDNGAKVVLAVPAQPSKIVDHALVEPDEISALRGPLALGEDVAARQHGGDSGERLRR